MKIHIQTDKGWVLDFEGGDDELDAFLQRAAPMIMQLIMTHFSPPVVTVEEPPSPSSTCDDPECQNCRPKRAEWVDEVLNQADAESKEGTPYE